jgi:hypothetical protein
MSDDTELHHVSLSVRPHVRTKISLKGLSLNLIWDVLIK